MTTIRHAALLVLIPTVLATLTTLSMEKNNAQLPLQEPKTPINNGKIVISSLLTSALYPLHTKTLVKSSRLTPLGEPYIVINSKNSANNEKLVVTIPAKKLYNCDDGSSLTLTFDNSEMLVTCGPNPKLPGKTFKEQYNNHMNSFYAKPEFFCVAERELINAGIITKKTRFITIFHTVLIEGYGYTQIPELIKKTIYKHGPNGCLNEKKLIKIIAAPYVKSYNNSMFQFTIGQQYGNKNHCRKLQPTTPKETQALFKRYKQLEPVEQQAEHKLMLTDK